MEQQLPTTHPNHNSNMAPRTHSLEPQFTMGQSLKSLLTKHFPTAGNSTVILAVPPTFSPDPVNMQCTNCGQRITTTTAVNTGLATWVACGAICALGGFLGCCFVPFCLDSMKDVRHTCPSCGAHLGTYHRMK
ncbi:LITAF domain-containing protein-like [Branchiostoma lanceolatum]|uniref:LITAF domain-containing protein-like n=1 Tax=Branchiostoma lanceolatum TaxID=7740 RepID=UPI003455632A